VLLENSFEVTASVDEVWPYLLDVEKVVVCMPGAELTEAIDEDNYKGRVKIRLGPVSLAFAGKVTVAERDDAQHRVVLKGSGMEQRGKGRATVSVTATAEESPGGTNVKIVQDLQIQGQIASMSRGMMNDVTAKLTKQFADCLQTNIGAGPAPAATPTASGDAAAAAPEGAERAAAPSAPPAGEQVPAGTTPAPRPAPAPRATGGEVSAVALALSALGGALRRLVARLVGRVKGRGRPDRRT
jgi:carbon monoxide dehydrogenase subunit G